ncbi:hypothetical protein [Chromobacterium haemolyticum]|uniref:hypothetical protein n=1 Tax=Chromobacterium haemolyticum TaxID=394935 RepID=UPI0024497C62|nr:hypothetical protein [Chromobacterium haemolyticum]MDH0342112.1 hypothetical protein [Chromobacterium haemolyticum]
MASVTIKIEDRADGGLDVQFKGDDLKTASTMRSNTAAQNAAILLSVVMRENGMTAPDLANEQALQAWLSKQAK